MTHSPASLASGAIPGWVWMCLMACGLLTVLKWATWRSAADRLPAVLTVGYFLAWPGLNAASFVGTSPDVARPRAREWAGPLLYLLAGLGIVWWLCPVVGQLDSTYAGMLGFAGLILFLHFGLFSVLALLWRRAGYDIRPIMNAPMRAASLLDFWSRRWNIAFRDAANQLIVRRFQRRLGPRTAAMLVFLVSGLVHELVITLPAGAGYGGPTLYFLIQAAGVGIQRLPVTRAWGLDRGLAGRVVTGVFLIAPVGFLFPSEFFEGVMAPFLDAIGAR